MHNMIYWKSVVVSHLEQYLYAWFSFWNWLKNSAAIEMSESAFDHQSWKNTSALSSHNGICDMHAEQYEGMTSCEENMESTSTWSMLYLTAYILATN